MGNLMGGGASQASKASGIHSRVFMDVCVGGKSGTCGRIVMDLHASTPQTSENFRALCTGEKGMGLSGKPLHFKNTKFHRVIPGFMAQGGDFTHGNGMGGESIYGHKFNDENFVEEHNGRGVLSMANAGPDTNGSQFFMCFTATPFLNGKHTVFGQVTDGMEMLDAMEKAGSPSGDTRMPITIEDCGQLEDSSESQTKA